MGSDCRADDMLEDLPANRCQGKGAVIGKGTLVTFLEDLLHMGMPPCCGDLTRLGGFVKKSGQCWYNPLCQCSEEATRNVVQANSFAGV